MFKRAVQYLMTVIVVAALVSAANAATFTQDFETANSPNTSYGYNGFQIANVFTTTTPDPLYNHGAMGRSTTFTGIDGVINGSGVGVASTTTNTFTWAGNFGTVFPSDVEVGPATDFVDFTTPDSSATFDATWPDKGNNVTAIESHIDVYLDQSWASGSGFDYSAAISDTTGDHRRDFIFHVYADGTDIHVDVSNNSDLQPKDVSGNANAYTIGSTGWYRLDYEFVNNNDVLRVDMALLPGGGGSALSTWSLSDASDIVTGTGVTVGGRNYGWFPTIEVGGDLYVDNAYYFNPEPSTFILVALSGAAALHRRRRRA